MSSLLLPAFYLPPISYMSKFANTENEITLEIFENIPKQTYRNRAYIYSSNGRLALSIPLQHNGKRQMKDIEISEVSNWRHLHWKSIKIAYQTSAFFEYYEDKLADIFKIKDKFLIDFNIKSLEIILNILKINKEISYTSSYIKDTNLLDFREGFHSKKESNFNMEIYFQNFEQKHGFIKDLSIIDLICNKGPETATYLKKIN